ncbi:hypothetical protein L228DRAFT_243423 [Xylona heveae TC161]|uniref:UBX domain-containing protein n=1 Tax=Xylona heveae (strain CBS 132557 / TC161) TaxID=1328760 RepID=A0A165K1M2_XYLHT|nr:hypothetical protein L228DRAFT_243423 [Xylona heveae TC161]KZF26887.1 hypothetical protein L228DRAFT_243423 [Xylona heveae TC161]
MDELVAQFTGITGTTPQRATQYLRLTDGNLEQAMQLFFESDGLDLEGSENPSTSATGSGAQSGGTRETGSSYRTDENGVINIDSDDEDRRPERTQSGRHISANFEDDEAMARRLQEELFSGGDMTGGADADGIRAPMARTTETLVGPDADWGSDPTDMRAAVEEQMLARRRPQGRPGIFNQRATATSVWGQGADSSARRQNLAEATAGASETSSKSSLLAEMYRPPFELMYRLPWDDARQEGRESEKWILVNVQDPAIFDCQILNRDLWKNDSIRDTVKENFIFLQYSKDDPRGTPYVQYYFQARDVQEAYPHIAIVDPRTGEQMKVWSGPPAPKAMDFLMQLHEFLDRYSLKANVRNPVATRKPEKKAMDVDRMTEEEMLQMAMQNSLANQPTEGMREPDPDDLTRGHEEEGSKGKGRAADAMSIDERQTGNVPSNESVFSRIASDKPHTEPGPDPTSTTRIQFRHPGGRIIRRFALGDPVRRLFEWLKADPIEGKDGVEFDLVCIGKNLLEVLDHTVEEAGLKNATVMVEFIEG